MEQEKEKHGGKVNSLNNRTVLKSRMTIKKNKKVLPHQNKTNGKEQMD